MFAKAKIAVVAALLAASALPVKADPMIDDSNTGLNTMYYYGPIKELVRQGLPVSANVRGHVTRSSARAQVFMLEDRGVVTGAGSDQHRPW